MDPSRQDSLNASPTGVHETCQPFQEQHYRVGYWAALWGFSEKTVREWFSVESGPGILRHSNLGRRKKRDYVTLMISVSAAARVYNKHSAIS